MDVKKSKILITLCFLLAFLGKQSSIEGKHGILRANHNLTSEARSDYFDLREKADDPCLPRIEGNHYNLYCLDNTNPGNLLAPQVMSNCGKISSFNYQERYLELGCSAPGFNGYFAPANWKAAKILGDGGVDVTGAPNEQLVEGANHTLISVRPGGMMAVQIAIPADGMITFDWSRIGGSNLFPDDFSVRINDRKVTVPKRAAIKGFFRTPVLHQGDLFSLLFTPQPQNDPLNLSVDNFRFLTSATGVIERTWTATDDQGRQSTFLQFISIERPNLTDIIFPENWDGVAKPALQGGQPTAPAVTGFPVIDRDGNLATTHDQYRLEGEELCGLDVKWTDEIKTIGESCVLLRHWVVTDWCGNNTMEETQMIKFIQIPGSAGCPENNLFQGPLPVPPSGKSPEVSERTGNYGNDGFGNELMTIY